MTYTSLLFLLLLAGTVLAGSACRPTDLPASGGVISGNSGEASQDEQKLPSCGTFPSGPALWYRIQPAAGQEMVASTCQSDPSLDTKLMVFQGDCKDLRCTTGNDDNCGLASLVEWTANGKSSYLIRLSFDERLVRSGASFQLTVSANEPSIVIETESVELYIPFRITFRPIDADDSIEGGFRDEIPFPFEIPFRDEIPFPFVEGPFVNFKESGVELPAKKEKKVLGNPMELMKHVGHRHSTAHALNAEPVHDLVSLDNKKSRMANMEQAELYIICNQSGETLLDYLDVTSFTSSMDVIVWGVQPNQQCFLSLEYGEDVQLSHEFFLSTGNGNVVNPYYNYEEEFFEPNFQGFLGFQRFLGFQGFFEPA